MGSINFRCRHCREKCLETGDKYCSECGTQLSWKNVSITHCPNTTDLGTVPSAKDNE